MRYSPEIIDQTREDITGKVIKAEEALEEAERLIEEAMEINTTYVTMNEANGARVYSGALRFRKALEALREIIADMEELER